MVILLREIQKTLLLAWPIIVSQLGQMLMQVIDSLMIGRLGAAPLAASAFAGTLLFLFMVFLFGASSCISALVARASGANRRNECAEILRHGCFLCTGVAVIFAVILTGMTPYLGMFGQPEEVIKEAQSYLPTIAWSLVPVLVFQVFRQFSEGLSVTILPMLFMALGIVVNAFFNWLLIFGNWGFPQWGLYGAGWGTLLARTLVAGITIFYILKFSSLKAYLPKNWWRPFRKKLFLRIADLGVPSGFQVLFEVGAFSGALIMMGWISTEALAAHQISMNLASLTFMIVLGISFAGSIRVGQAVGAQKLDELRRIGLSAFSFVVLMMLSFGLFFYMGRYWLPSLYIKEVGVIHLAAQFLVVAALFQIFDGIQGIGIGLLRGLTDVKIPMLINFIAYWLISLPVGYLLAFTYELDGIGIWLGLLFGLVVAALALCLRFYHLTRQMMDA